MLWISWLLCAVVFAVLFSVVKTVDRLCYSIELIDARLDHLTRSVEHLTGVINATAPQLDRAEAAHRERLA